MLGLLNGEVLNQFSVRRRHTKPKRQNDSHNTIYGVIEWENEGLMTQLAEKIASKHIIHA
jgi:hypothetical protein